MSQKTSIEWVSDSGGQGRSWNTLSGCDETSPGCKSCYAKSIAYRFSEQPNSRFFGKAKRINNLPVWTGGVTELPDELLAPLSWRAPSSVFVNSMSDSFHRDVSDSFLHAMFGVMAATPKNRYFVLTKRAERMQCFLSSTETEHQVFEWMLSHPALVGSYAIGGNGAGHYPPLPRWPLQNVFIGVSVEDQKRADERIPLLLQTPAAYRFLSCEPLLEDINIRGHGLSYHARMPAECKCGHGHGFTRCPNTGGIAAECHKCDCWRFKRPPYGDGIHLCIIGGESGHHARPFHLDWARNLIAQSRDIGASPFMKQAGSNASDRYVTHDTDGDRRVKTKKRKGNDLAELPAELRVREMPA